MAIFYSINPTDLWAWEYSPSSGIFNFLEVFYHASFLLAWLKLQGYFISFEAITKGVFPMILSQSVICIQESYVFCCFFFWVNFMMFSHLTQSVRVSQWNFSGPLCMLSYHLQIKILWLFPFPSVSLWFPSVALLL